MRRSRGTPPATVTPPPEALRDQGFTHWSARRLADWLRREKKLVVSHDSITRLWRRFCLQPHRTEGFKFSTDPQLDAKVRDVVGLYLAPPENAVVVCVDEKSQCQALERSQPILPMRSGDTGAADPRLRPARRRPACSPPLHTADRPGHRRLLPASTGTRSSASSPRGPPAACPGTRGCT